MSEGAGVDAPRTGPDAPGRAEAGAPPGAADDVRVPGDGGSGPGRGEGQAPGGDGHDPTAGRPASGGPESSRAGLWIKGLGPLALLAVFVVLFLQFGPVGVFRAAFPPVEELTIERVVFPEPGLIRVHLVNGGPEPVTVAQVMVDEAYWDFTLSGDPVMGRLKSRTVEIPYPWVEGDPVEVTVVTSTGLTFSAEVDVATTSPRPDARYLSTFALLGVYVGVIPVFLGLLWLPFLSGIPRRWLDFFLALTMGLLVFLGVDALVEALELAEGVAPAFQGTGLVLLGLVGTPLAIDAVGRLRSGRVPGDGRAAGGAVMGSTGAGGGPAGGPSPLGVAFLVALGIGLHNLGEGLAIGASYAVGEIALGTTLVLGFLLHNTTEGVGIVAPVADDRPSLGTLVLLGAIAGVPTILGAWIGGFTYSPALTVLFFAIGAGAVVQVVWVLGKLLAGREGGLATPLNAVGLVAGLALMYLTGMFVAA